MGRFKRDETGLSKQRVRFQDLRGAIQTRVRVNSPVDTDLFQDLGGAIQTTAALKTTQPTDRFQDLCGAIQTAGFG